MTRGELDYRGLGFDPPSGKRPQPARYGADFSGDMQPAKFDADFSVDLGSDPRDRSLPERVNRG